MKVKMYRTVYDTNRYPVIVAENGNYVCDGRKKFSSPELVYDFCTQQLGMDRQTEEYVYCFCLDTSRHLTGLFEVTHGTVNASLISPREIFQKLLLLGATSFIMAHNHPSGDIAPSQEDINITASLEKCGRMMDIPLLDHIIVGYNAYYSFKEMS